MIKNSFKELEEELQLGFTSQKQEEIKRKVRGSMDVIKMVGDFFDLYISKFISYLLKSGSK